MVRLPRIRRLFRISLRTALVAMVILCIMLGLKVRQVQQQQEVIAWVRDLEGGITFDYECDSLTPPFDSRLPGPEWLHALVGVDYFRTPHSITLYDGSDLSPLATLTELRGLTLNSDDIEDLSPLTKLNRLANLIVVSDKVSDLSPLANLTSLERLTLSGGRIRDLSPLCTLAKLKELVVISDAVTTLSPLTKLANLQLLLLCTPIIPSGEVASLQKTLPTCTVWCGEVQLRMPYSVYDEPRPRRAFWEYLKSLGHDGDEDAPAQSEVAARVPSTRDDVNSGQTMASVQERLEAMREMSRNGMFGTTPDKPLKD